MLMGTENVTAAPADAVPAFQYFDCGGGSAALPSELFPGCCFGEEEDDGGGSGGGGGGDGLRCESSPSAAAAELGFAFAPFLLPSSYCSSPSPSVHCLYCSSDYSSDYCSSNCRRAVRADIIDASLKGRSAEEDDSVAVVAASAAHN